MSYTTRNGQPQGIPYCFTNKIREAMIAEIIAINGYAEHIANSNMKELNTAWQSIMGDEKNTTVCFLRCFANTTPINMKNIRKTKV